MPTDSDEALKAWKAFLESTPPNTPVTIPDVVTMSYTSVGASYRRITGIRIQLYCQVDDGTRWFDCSRSEIVIRETWAYDFVRYTCRDCGRSVKTFAVLVKRADANTADAEVMKLGEYPPFGAPISARIQKLLTKDDLELYRKGTRAEAQGLGIGAASYFRRVVESQWKLLVMEIRDAAQKLGATDLTVFDKALNETQFSTAVGMLRDAIPPKLLVLDGQNPLTLLHRPLSVQLHDLSDAECLQEAADIRVVLTALLDNIADVLSNQDELKAAAARLGQPKS